jgi:hypothetical protein
MTKAEALRNWAKLPANQNPLPHMSPIRKGTTGSRYGACGIRIDGTPEFIDAVLSCLKPLIDGENQVTRLELARNEVKSTEINGERKSFVNAARNAECCYIRLHERGPEAIAYGAMLNGHLRGATERFADALGVE